MLNLADLVSPRHVILGGKLGAALANLSLLAAGGAAFGIPLRFATGFFLAAVYPAAFKLMSTWFRRERGLALGVLAAAIALCNGVKLALRQVQAKGSQAPSQAGTAD